MQIPPSLVLGCNTPHGLGVLSDWIEEQTGIAPDFIDTGWSDGYSIGIGNAIVAGYGCGYGYGDGDGDGYGDGFGYGYGYCGHDGIGIGYGNEFGDGSGSGNSSSLF